MPNYGEINYWEQRYKDQEGATFDWLEDFEALQPLIEHAVGDCRKDQCRILNLGCGNSILAEEMYDQGYTQIYNIDISPTVVEQMVKRNSIKRPDLKWEVMDARNLTYPSNLFDMIVDKSTIDALLCGDHAHTNVAKMQKEGQRVLKEGGVYMVISYGTPDNRVLHFKRPHLKFDIKTFQIQPEGAKSKDALFDNQTHYVYVLRKMEGADKVTEQMWPQVEAQIKKEEQDEDYSSSDSDLDEANIKKNQDDDKLEESKQQIVSVQPSPYPMKRRDDSKSPDIESMIQGNIDNQMSSQQIINKKAFVWAFGKNKEGELSFGMNKDVLLPRFINGLQGNTAKFIASSNHHTAIVTQDGQLLVCGSNLHGKLGVDGLNKTNITKLQSVQALAKRKVKQVACGDYQTLCLLEDCTVYQFGGSQKKTTGPTPIQTLQGKDIIQIDCGDFHSAALDANGDLYTWGGGTSSYNKGQCGHGHTNLVEQPEKVQSLTSKRIVQIACGGFHTLALTSENELYGFGSGVYGECGYGEFQDTYKPKLVKFPSSDSQYEEGVLDKYLKESICIAQIACGGRHSLVVTSNGKLYSFGYGQNGQLGLRNNSNYAKPQLIKDLQSKKVVAIAAGWNHSLVLTDQSDLYATGHNQYGQLGLGDKESKTSFTHVTSLGNKNIVKVFAGGNHSWVVLNDMIPTRDNYKIPSPIKQHDRSTSNTPLRKPQQSPFQPSSKANEKVQEQQLTTDDDFIQQLLELQQKALNKAQYYLQVTYTDTEYCHRFINFEIPKQIVKQFESQLEEYIQQCYSQDKSILYHKVQEVPSNLISNKPTLGEKLLFQQIDDSFCQEQESDNENDQQKAYTLCMIANPSNHEQKFQEYKSEQEKYGKLKKVVLNSSGMFKTMNNDENQAPLIGKIVFLKDSDIEGNEYEYIVNQWILNFHKKLTKYCVKKPRYSELRPMKYSLT